MSNRLRFRTGERIPHSGIYKVFHASHRLPHEVTLLDGETFPRCLKCESAVEFELIQQAPDIRNQGAFRVVLFGLPATDETPDETAATNDTDQATQVDVPPDQIAAAESTPMASFSQSDTLPGDGTHLLPGDGTHLASTKYKSLRKFKPGDQVPEHGIYIAEHHSHGLFHQVTLGKGTRFPGCRTCRHEVRFRLLRAGKPGSVVAPLSSSILEDLDAPEPPSTKVG